MAHVFNFPDVGEGIHEGRVVEWLVAEGETVAEDQPLLKVETDKAVVELPSPNTGTVLKLHVPADATIEVGDALITIGAAGEALPESEATRNEPKLVEVPPPAAAETTSTATGSGRRRPLATPRTRAMARKLGVDLGAVRGSGSGGRITDEDVDRAAAGPSVSSALAAVAAPAGIAETTSHGDVERH